MTHHPAEQVLHFDETNAVRLEFVADDLATETGAHVDKLEVNLVEDGPSFQAWKLSNFTGIIIARRIEKTHAASSPLQEGEALSVSPVGSPLSLQESSTKDGSSMDEEDAPPITTPTAASVDATLSPVREDASAESSETSSLKQSDEIDMPLFSAPNETLPSVMENSRAEALDFSGSEDGFHDRRPAVVADNVTHVHGNEAMSAKRAPEIVGLATKELATPLLRDDKSNGEVGTESEPSIPVTSAAEMGSGDVSSSKKLSADSLQKEDQPESVSSHSEKQNGDASPLKMDDDNRFAFYIPETTIFEADRPQSESIPSDIQQKSWPISEYGDNEDVEQEDGELDDGSMATTSSGLSFGSSINSGNAKKLQPEKLLQLVKKAKNDARNRRHSEYTGKPPQTTATTEKPTRKSFRSPLNETASSRLSRLSNFDLSSLTALSNHTSNHSHDGSGKHGRNMVNRALNKTAKGAGMIAKGAAKATGLSHLKSAVNFRGYSASDTKEESEEESDKGSSFPSKSRWSFVVNMHNVKMKVPQKVRMRRQERRMTTSDGSLQVYKAPTRLHELCADPDVVLEDLMAELARSPQACKVTDAKGRLPIHWLGDNDGLVSKPLGKATASSFAWHLLKAHPKSITTLDHDGFAPFVCLIRDWQSWTYETKEKDTDSKKDTPTNLFKDIASTLGPSKDDESIPVTVDRVTTTEHPDGLVTTSLASGRQFPRVSMWEEVEWCFNMLSMAMDELGGKNGGLNQTSTKKRDQLEMFNHDDLEARDFIAKHLTEVMPSLLKTLLLMEDEGGDARKRMLDSSVVRRILLCPESVGTWLTSMLRKKGIPSSRAIDYLVLISELDVDDYVGGYRTVLPEDILAFHEARDKVYESLDDIEGIVASLVVLDNAETERAAATHVVWHIMSKNLARPFVVALTTIDFVLHITLLLAFRSDVSFYSLSSIGDVPTEVVYFICAHYLIRKACEGLSLLGLSITVFRSYFTNLWTIFDMIAIIMTIAAMSWNDSHPREFRNGLNAFVLGLLWIKILSFLKVVNKQMSTFILALIRIIIDLRYFAIVLTVIILMFADMFRIAVSTMDNGEFCIEKAKNGELIEGPVADFCSTNAYLSYLRVYSLLIGDFELDWYRETTGMTVLFVIFTVIGVIILLNVLIAVISDSYEKAKIKSLLLFGRARVSFVAQNQALESFLRPGTNPIAELKLANSSKGYFVAFGRMLRWLVLLSLVGTALYAEVYLFTQSIEFIRARRAFMNVVFMVIIVVILTAALWVLAFYSLSSIIVGVLPRCCRCGFTAIDNFTGRFARKVASFLFGLNVSSTPDEEGNVEEEWTGRLGYLEKRFEKRMDKVSEHLTDEIMALEKRLYEHEELQQQKSVQKERVKDLWKETSKKLKAMKLEDVRALRSEDSM